MQVKNEVFCIAFLECLYLRRSQRNKKTRRNASKKRSFLHCFLECLYQTLCSKKLRYCANYLT